MLSLRNRVARRLRDAALAVCLAALAACRTAEPTSAEPPAPPAIPADGNEFVAPYTVNDTWNAVGQILVDIPGVTYESRSQMLAIYALRFRGESFLLRVQGLPLDPAAPELRTRVEALTPAGAPLRTVATAELLAVLAVRVPAEAPYHRERLQAQEKAKAEAARRKPAKKKASASKK